MQAKLAYTGIRVRDLEASIRFYTQVLGMTERERGTIAETHGVVVDLVSGSGGPTLELNFYEPGTPFDAPYVPGEGLDHLGFKVGDLEGAVRSATQAGFPVIQEIRAAGQRWVYLEDPNGIWIELSE